MRSPKISVPLINSSKVSSTPARPGMVAISSSMPRHLGMRAQQQADIDVDHRLGVDGVAHVAVAGRVLVGRRLLDQPGQRLEVGAFLVELPLGLGLGVGLAGDHHGERVGGDLAAGLRRIGLHARHRVGAGRRRVDALGEAEIVVGVFGGEFQAGVAGAGADDLHVGLGPRAEAAVVHGEELALEVAHAGLPEVAQDADILGGVAVAMAEVRVARPQSHLGIFRPLPAGDDVEAEPAARDRIDGRAHARGDRRRHGEGRHRGVEPDARGHRGQSCHQGEGFEVVVPELAFAAEAPELDHRQHEIEPVALGIERGLPVELEARLVLRRGRRDQPAVAADRDEDSDFHGAWSPPHGGSRTDRMQKADRAECQRLRQVAQVWITSCASRRARHANFAMRRTWHVSCELFSRPIV